ncbi:MAG: hypothetical protein LBB38_02325 [Puniceicoccales bacterium]|nr:hypothetical protein [Puniceicoccales bacterium]
MDKFENAVALGNLSKLTPAERATLYARDNYGNVCLATVTPTRRRKTATVVFVQPEDNFPATLRENFGAKPGNLIPIFASMENGEHMRVGRFPLASRAPADGGNRSPNSLLF